MTLRPDHVPEDAWVMENAAKALRRRSKRPRSLMLAVICNLLISTAEKIRLEEQDRSGRD